MRQWTVFQCVFAGVIGFTTSCASSSAGSNGAESAGAGSGSTAGGASAGESSAPTGRAGVGGGGGTNAGSAATGGKASPTGGAGMPAGGRASAGSPAAGSGGSAGTGAAGGGSAPNPSGRWVAGYYVGYQQDLYPVETIDFSGLTHLVIARVTPQSDASLNTTYDVDPTNGPLLAKKLVDAAHKNGKKAILMLGGAGQHDNFVAAASDSNRSRFVQGLVQLMTDVGYDGFDIDWEPIMEADFAQLQALASALRKSRPDVTLLLPVNWSGGGTLDKRFKDLASVFDQVNIMTYSMAGAWDGWKSWHSSALQGSTPNTPTSVDVSVKGYLAAGIPAAKLGIGVGFFGLCWTAPVTAPKQDLNGSQMIAGDNDMSFTNIMASYYSDSAHKYDDEAAVPYLGFSGGHGPKSCSFVSYEDAQSIRAKADYVKKLGLGGSIVWTINQGYLPNAPAGQKDPLMKALGAFLE